ncbi:MAG: cyclic nucleotide-binding domain-containing protein, partial [Spirochaetia bacterium]|nr:cyclic nucleotide-binding domain-containing protein [Spirochaetia bacterium]
EDWLTTLMSNIEISMFNAGDVIMKQGEVSKGMIYIILTGNVSVKLHDGHSLRERAVKDAGDFIGEMAIVTRMETRSASIVARTPVTLGEIPEEIFYRFLTAENRIDDIKEKWRKRSEIETEWPFHGFSDIVNERIANASLRREIRAGEVVLHENEPGSRFYIIIRGEFEVLRAGTRLNIIKPGDIFGEYGSLESRVRNATIQAMTDGVIFEISSEEIRKILDATPAFHSIIRRIFRMREEITAGS